MKKIIFTLIAGTVFMLSDATAQLKFPAPSPAQTVKQDFGLGSIELSYSRPAAKGRKVFGDLVPYGKLWRTGANAATKISFSEPVEINGKKLDSGTYVIYTIPGVESWEVIFNKGLNNGGPNDHKESEDALRFKTEPVKMKTKTESFTMQFTDVKPETCELQLLWENQLVKVPISTNIKDKIRTQLEAALQSDKKPYWQAAQFYNEYDKNLNKALEYVSKATDANPTAFYMYLYKAKIQKEMGDIAGAMETSKKSLELSKEAKNDDYISMNEKLQKELKGKK